MLRDALPDVFKTIIKGDGRHTIIGLSPIADDPLGSQIIKDVFAVVACQAELASDSRRV